MSSEVDMNGDNRCFEESTKGLRMEREACMRRQVYGPLNRSESSAVLRE